MRKRSIKYVAALLAAIIGGVVSVAAAIATLLWAIANGLTTIILLYFVAGILLGLSKALALA